MLSIPSIYHLFFQLRAKFALKVCIHKYNIFFSRTLSAMFLLPSLSWGIVLWQPNKAADSLAGCGHLKKGKPSEKKFLFENRSMCFKKFLKGRLFLRWVCQMIKDSSAVMKPRQAGRCWVNRGQVFVPCSKPQDAQMLLSFKVVIRIQFLENLPINYNDDAWCSMQIYSKKWDRTCINIMSVAVLERLLCYFDSICNTNPTAFYSHHLYDILL